MAYADHGRLSCVGLYNSLQENAYVYVCGDAEKMARDVHAALKKIITTHSEWYASEAEAETFLTELKQRQRYVLDVWT